MSHARTVALILLASSLGLSGCLGGGDEAPAAVDAAGTETNETSTVLPDGREFAAIEETNKTEEGVGGIEHLHDYWMGAETVTVFDADVNPDLQLEREDNTKIFIGFINLEKLPGDEERDAIVFEGTGLVTFTLTSGPAWADTYQLSFRTAGADWSAPTPIKLGDAFEYAPAKTEVDMPHSFRSLWNWKVQAIGPVPVTGQPRLFGEGIPEPNPAPLHATIIVTKAHKVDDWPGHPAFYDGVSERVVVDNAQGKTTVQQAADVLVYGIEPDQVVPDKLVSMGTGTLDVYVNITKLELPPGMPNGGFQLFWRSADVRPNDLGWSQHHNESDDTTYAYWHLNLDDDMVDSPYQPTSRFSFKVLATPANDDVLLCYRCVPYNIEYTITVIARPVEGAAPMEM